MSFNLHTDYNGKITKKDLKKVFWRSIPMEHSWNYERMDNVGYAWALYPVLKKLYPDEKDLAKAMKRHLTLYNMTPYICTFPMGISVAMEEANAEQEDFDTESIGSVKTAMMGPLSGIGDAFFWGTLRVIATSIGCALAMKEDTTNHRSHICDDRNERSTKRMYKPNLVVMYTLGLFRTDVILSECITH